MLITFRDLFFGNFLSFISLIAFIVSTFVFLGASIYLSQFNFDLHHEGYIFSQSSRLLQGEAPKDVFMQYGVLYHAIVSLTLLIADGSPYPSRIVAVILTVLTVSVCHLNLRSCQKYRYFGAAIWLLSCFWLTRYFQFFVQFSPSLLALFLLSLLFWVFCSRNKVLIGKMLTVTISSFLTVCLLHVKINYGVLSVPICLACFGTLGLRLRHILAYCFAVTMLLWISLNLLGYKTSEILSLVEFHQNFVTDSNVFGGLYRTLLLDLGHGGVYQVYLILFILPVVALTGHALIGLLSTMEQKRLTILNRVFADRKNQLLAIFAIFGWLTIFPTGSYQHIWFGGLFGIFFFVSFIESVLVHDKVKFVFLSTLLALAFSNFTYGFASKLFHMKDYTMAGQGIYAGLVISKGQQKFLDFVHVESQNKKSEGCHVLNLTPNGIYSGNASVFCGIEKNGSNFFWESNNKITFKEFVKKIRSWNGVLLSEVDELQLIASKLLKFSVTGQDFGSQFSLFKLNDENLEIDTLLRYWNQKSEHKFERKVFYRAADTLIEDLAREPDDTLYFNQSCEYLRLILKRDPDLPLKFISSDNCLMLYNRSIKSDPLEALYLIVYLKTVTTNRISWGII
jgi:hypothetical protein